ncbi:MAG: ATPase, T2SS/T4P/T4SS family, partial [Actinomycetes bacterium]
MWDTGATDLHLCAGTTPRVRIDGKLLAVPQAQPLSAATVQAMTEGLLPPGERETFQHQRQLDFAFSWADTARFRVNAYHQLDRPALALRLIPSKIPTPEQLGLPAAADAMVQKTHGLVLVTGPTGSGKSTTPSAT